MPALILQDQFDQVPDRGRLCVVDKPLVALQTRGFFPTVSVQRFHNFARRMVRSGGVQTSDRVTKLCCHSKQLGRRPGLRIETKVPAWLRANECPSTSGCHETE
jgi:hypothetical protein